MRIACETLAKSRTRPHDDDLLFHIAAEMTNLLAAAHSYKSGMTATVYDMFSVKPVDKDAVQSAKKYKLAVTVEEHNKMGGLGAAVAELMTEQIGMPKLLRCGIHDSFDLACDYDGLLVQNRLTPELIADDIYRAIDNV